MPSAPPQMIASLQVWHKCIATRQLTLLPSILSDKVIFRSPFLWKAKHGKEITAKILTAATQVFENFTYHRELFDETSCVLEFSARIGEVSLKGIDLIRFDEAGKIVEFEVMIRPIKGLQALAEAMAQQLQRQGDWEVFLQS